MPILAVLDRTGIGSGRNNARQGHLEFRPVLILTLVDSNGAFERLDDVADQIKAEARAGSASLQFAAKPDEAAEYFTPLVGWNTSAVVENRNPYRVGIDGTRLNLNVRRRTAILHRVVN